MATRRECVFACLPALVSSLPPLHRRRHRPAHAAPPLLAPCPQSLCDKCLWTLRCRSAPLPLSPPGVNDCPSHKPHPHPYPCGLMQSPPLLPTCRRDRAVPPGQCPTAGDVLDCGPAQPAAAAPGHLPRPAAHVHSEGVRRLATCSACNPNMDGQRTSCLHGHFALLCIKRAAHAEQYSSRKPTNPAPTTPHLCSLTCLRSLHLGGASVEWHHSVRLPTTLTALHLRDAGSCRLPAAQVG